MNAFRIWWHNVRVGDPRLKLIKCKHCGLIQREAYKWDYQICKCGKYLYDVRDLF